MIPHRLPTGVVLMGTHDRAGGVATSDEWEPHIDYESGITLLK